MRTKPIVMFLVGMLLLLVTSSSNAEMRKWTRENGKQFEAEFVKFERHDDGAQIVTVRKPNGTEMDVHLLGLSEEDQKYVGDHAKSDKSEVGTKPASKVPVAVPEKPAEKPHPKKHADNPASASKEKPATQPGKPAPAEKEIALDLGSGAKLEMVLIPAGEFLMGSPDSDKDARDTEKPQHRVRITKPFYLGKYLVTQEQWEAVMGDNPAQFKGVADPEGKRVLPCPKRPVEQVSWDACQMFIETINTKSARGEYRFALPTEAQWEYACRAGSTSRYCFGDDASQLGGYAWYRENSGAQTHTVGEKKPNAWGLYDMYGNVWQWCADEYDLDYYGKSPTENPCAPTVYGSQRARRGGSHNFAANNCRSASRGSLSHEYGMTDVGFRVCVISAEK